MMQITLGTISMLQGTPWKGDKTEAPHEVSARLDAALGGIVDEVEIEHVRESLTKSLARIDSVTVALLVHHEINPAIALSMAIDASVLNMSDGMGRQALMLAPDMSSILLDIGRPAIWQSHGVLDQLPELPDTVVGVFQPMPLRGFISHPVLDALDLHAEVIETRDSTHVVVSGTRWVRTAALIDMLPEPTW